MTAPGTMDAEEALVYVSANCDPEFLEVAPGEEAREFNLRIYFGAQYDKLIVDLDNAPLIEPPVNAFTGLHPWQIKGGSQLHWLCRSDFRGGICGDAMGLGKTKQGIYVIEQARKETGSFSLIVCAEARKQHWFDQIKSCYEPNFMPKTVLLENHKMTASRLHAEQAEIVIINYGDLEAEYREKENFKDLLKQYKKHGGEKPTRPCRPTTSELWKRLDLPIKRLILDEAHLIKNHHTTRYQAVRNLRYNAVVSFSGKFQRYIWSDVFASISLLEGHPFQDFPTFCQVFCSKGYDKNSVLRPGNCEIDGLSKFMMGLPLPGRARY